MELLFLFCADPGIDPVAPFIFKQAKDYYFAKSSTLMVGGRNVFQTETGAHRLFFAETPRYASEMYAEISHEINAQFPNIDMIGLINWHSGANAPEKIFCGHSTADVPSGVFGPTSGELLAATLMAMEAERSASGLNDFRTLFEASHWSGLMYGRQASELLQIQAPVFDIEIGSFPADWSNVTAQQVLVKALGKIPDFCGSQKPRALYLGGTHFEASASEIVFQSAVIEHHLPNQWLVSGEYHLPGAEAKIVSAAKSCLKPPELIVFHAGLKSVYKECARQAANALGIPCVSHKQLRTPDWKQTLLTEKF